MDSRRNSIGAGNVIQPPATLYLAGLQALDGIVLFGNMIASCSPDKKAPMRAHVSYDKVQHVLQTLHDHQRLTGLVRSMAYEIARLDEDNIQLHAAVKMYREVLRRYNAGREAGKPRPH
jgi:hypothetical protein